MTSCPFEEPLLAVENIQGHILTPFNRARETHVYVAAEDARALRRLLAHLLPLVTPMGHLLRAAGRDATNEARGRVLAHVGLGYRAISLLRPDDAARFADIAFREGMSERSIDVLRDPVDASEGEARRGNRRRWLFGGPHNPVDVAVLLAADDEAPLREARDRLIAVIDEIGAEAPRGPSNAASLRVVHVQEAALLPPPFEAREHFGYRDPISQPGVRGA